MKEILLLMMVVVTCFWGSCRAQNPRPAERSSQRFAVSRRISIGSPVPRITIGSAIPRITQINPRTSRLLRSGRIPRTRSSSLRSQRANTRVPGMSNTNSTVHRQAILRNASSNRNRLRPRIGSSVANLRVHSHVMPTPRGRGNIRVVEIPPPFNRTMAIPVQLQSSRDGRLLLRRISTPIRRSQSARSTRVTGSLMPDSVPRNTMGLNRLSVSSPRVNRQRLLRARTNRHQSQFPRISRQRLATQRQVHQRNPLLHRQKSTQNSTKGRPRLPNTPQKQTTDPILHRQISNHSSSTQGRPMSPGIKHAQMTNSRLMKVDPQILARKPVSVESASSRTTASKKISSRPKLKQSGMPSDIPSTKVMSNPHDMYNGTEMVLALNDTLRRYGLDIDGLISLLQETMSRKKVTMNVKSGGGIFRTTTARALVGSGIGQQMMPNINFAPINPMLTLTNVRNELRDIALLLEGEAEVTTTTVPPTNAPKPLIESTGNHVMDEMILQLLYKTLDSRMP